MIAGSRSRTIDRPALMRAAHQLLDDEPKIFRDPFAVGLTEAASRAEIERCSSELLAPACKLLRSAIVLRSRYAEDALAEAVERGVAQYVILGAGLDTFAFRQPAYAARLRIFEVDHPATQRWKLERILSIGATLPANVAHVAVDLAANSLDKTLREAGFEPSRPAFFSCLGLCQYLDRRAIFATLRYVAGLESASGMAMSFNPPENLLDGLDREEARSAAARAEALGEPWRTRPTVEGVTEQLRGLGFSRVEHLHPVQANMRYFNGRNDGLRAATFEQLVSAFV